MTSKDVNMNIIQDISEFIFVENDPQQVDIIFIPGGSWWEPSKRAAELWIKGYAPLILPSGRYGRMGKFAGVKSKREIYNEEYETEWDFMKDVLVKSGLDEKAILMENRATDTFQNALFSKEVTDSLGLSIRKAIICCKSFHARRCLMTYAYAYPQTEFLVCPSDINNIIKNNWFEREAGIEQVMSELQKCGQYFKDAVPSFRDKN